MIDLGILCIDDLIEYVQIIELGSSTMCHNGMLGGVYCVYL